MLYEVITPGYEGIIMLVIMFAIFYFLLIRPQQKRAKQHKELIDSLKIGDQVVTAGGIHGKVAALQDTIVTVEVAMVTGDHPATALAIARELGMADHHDHIVTGPEFV